MIDRPLSTTLSLALLTLGVGLISLILQINQHIQQQMENNVQGIDMVVGAKGSPLQLILSAIYHIDDPTGNISLEEAEELRKNRLVESGIPLAYGDSYEGYRIVGTTHDYPELYGASVGQGRFWQEAFEVTIGSKVAQDLDLAIGSTFSGIHGLTEDGQIHADHDYQVVGILTYSNSVVDQLILTATESVWEVHHPEEESIEDHEHHDHKQNDHLEDEHRHEKRELTAMLIQFRNPMGMIQLPRIVNETTSMQAAIPSYEISRLFSLMGVGIDTMSALALIIMGVSGLSLFISLYNALKDREYEMALLRSYGASRWQLVWMVLQEGLLLTSIGFLSGIIISRTGLWLISILLESDLHYSFSGWVWLQEEWWLLSVALTIGLLASLLPAIRVFHINISKTLANA